LALFFWRLMFCLSVVPSTNYAFSWFDPIKHDIRLFYIVYCVCIESASILPLLLAKETWRSRRVLFTQRGVFACNMAPVCFSPLSESASACCPVFRLLWLTFLPVMSSAILYLLQSLIV
jgi:hypothetical protein